MSPVVAAGAAVVVVVVVVAVLVVEVAVVAERWPCMSSSELVVTTFTRKDVVVFLSVHLGPRFLRRGFSAADRGPASERQLFLASSAWGRWLRASPCDAFGKGPSKTLRVLFLTCRIPNRLRAV